MMKKATVLLCSIFVFSSLATADAFAQKATEEKNVKTVSMKTEREAYNKELQRLVNKYSSASEKDKSSIRNEMSVLVADYTEKDLSYKKEKLVKDKERIARQEKEITDIENDKAGHINKEIDFYLSDKGQKKLQKANNKKEKKQ